MSVTASRPPFSQSKPHLSVTALNLFRLGMSVTGLLLHTSSLLAQSSDLRFDRISVEQGLSHFSLTGIVQDHQGFLWFGTEDGLNKYDGHTFTVYRPVAQDSNSLPHPSVTALLVDRHGRLWVGTVDGLCRYDPEANKFVRYRHIAHDPQSLPANGIRDIFEDATGKLWIGTNAGLCVHDEETDRFERHFSNASLSDSLNNDIRAIFAERVGDLWVGTADGLQRFDPKTKTFVPFPHQTGASADLFKKAILQIAEDSRGDIWLATGAGLQRYDRKAGKVVRCQDSRYSHLLNTDITFALYTDRQGMLWIGTYHSGLFRYDPITGSFSRYVHEPNNPSSLDRSRISCIFEDRSGVLWVGTYRGGLNRHDHRQDVFERHAIDGAVHAVLLDTRSNLWLGTFGNGLFRIEQENGQPARRVKHYLHDPAKPASLSSNEVLSLLEDRSGEIWIGTGKGLSRYEVLHDRFVHYKHAPLNPAIAGHRAIKIIYEDHQGALWIGTTGSGLYRLDHRRKTFAGFRNDPRNPQSLSGNDVWSITEDGEGDLWIGTFGEGLNRNDRQSERFVRYRDDLRNPDDLNSVLIYSVYADPSGPLWIGTFLGGLHRLDRETGAFTHYTEQDGLPDNFVKGILADDHGHLWLSTDKGLARFDPKNGISKNYTRNDGLHGNVFLSGAYHRGHDGRFYFGGEGGVTAFHPDSIPVRPCTSPVVLTSFKVFDQPLQLPPHPTSTQEIRLAHEQNFFSFEMAVLDYARPARSQYAHLLEGFDRDWIHTGTRRCASYTNVPPGQYTLRVKGTNADGVWNEDGVAVKITITPPFWKTWWFTGLFGTTLLITIGGTIRYLEIRKLRARLRAAEKQQALERERVRISQDMHDDVSAGLTEIAILSELAKRNLSQPQAARAHLMKISARAREVVDNLGEIIWAINPKHDQLGDFAAYLRHHAVQYLMLTGISYRCDFPEALAEVHLSAEMRRNLFLVFKEALHNLVKHAGATVAELRLTCSAQQLEISIRDNGRGFSPEPPAPFRNGLANMKKRIDDIGGRFILQSQPNCGTQIRVVVGLKGERQYCKIERST